MLCLSEVVTGCHGAHMDGQLAAKAARCVSVGRINQNDAPSTRRSYNCAFCPSTFKWKYTLKCHISAVHEGKRFACTQCQCTFVSRSGLTEHVKHVHHNLPRYNFFNVNIVGKDFPIARIYADILPLMLA